MLGRVGARKGDVVMWICVLCGTDLFQVRLHDLGSVVDSQHDVSDTSLGKGLDLVLDHRLVGKLDKGFGKSQGLWRRRCH